MSTATLSPVDLAPAERPRTYEVRTYGCQMNVHDSERLSGLLEDAGYVPVADGEQAEHEAHAREERAEDVPHG